MKVVLQRMLKSVNQPGTHLPDCIVFADHRRELPFQATFQGVLMFLDISGYIIMFSRILCSFELPDIFYFENKVKLLTYIILL